MPDSNVNLSDVYILSGYKVLIINIMVLYSGNDLISEFFYQMVFLFPPHNLYLFH